MGVPEMPGPRAGLSHLSLSLMITPQLHLYSYGAGEGAYMTQYIENGCFFLFKKSFLLAYIHCTQGFHCDISIQAYNVL
jgi:hypothetical protein